MARPHETSESYLNAVKVLPDLEPRELMMALDTVKQMELLAVMKHKKEVAIEMVAMRGEILKVMLAQVVEKDGKAPEGLTLEQGRARVDEAIETEIAELEAA